MKKRLFFILRYAIIIFLIVSTYMPFGINNEEYVSFLTQMNFWSKITTGITFEGIRYLSFVFPMSLSILVFLILGLFVLFPAFSKIFDFLEKTINMAKELKEIKSQEVHTDEEQIAKVNKMLDVMEEKGTSLISFLDLLLSVILGFGLLQTIFGRCNELISLTNNSSQLLWFDILNSDPYFIIPILTLLVYTGVYLLLPLINKIKTKAFSNPKERVSSIFFIMIFISTSLFFLPVIFGSCIFAFFLLINTFAYLWQILLKSKRKENSNEHEELN